MKFVEINPFVRYAKLQPTIMSSAPFGCAKDHRIFYVLEGSAELVFLKKTIWVRQGALVYIRPGTPYYFNGNIKTIVLNFDLTYRFSMQKKGMSVCKNVQEFCEDDILEKDAPIELSKTIVIENAIEVEQELKDCIRYFSYPSDYSEVICSANVKKILCYLVQKEKEPSQNLPSLVRDVLLYIQQHYDKGIDNEQIAKVFGYHSFYLNRIFKKATGNTIHQTILMQQIHVAKQLLKNTELSVKNIAYESGFSDASLFCNVFKKNTGFTPTEYRKRNPYSS